MLINSISTVDDLVLLGLTQNLIKTKHLFLGKQTVPLNPESANGVYTNRANQVKLTVVPNGITHHIVGTTTYISIIANTNFIGPQGDNYDTLFIENDDTLGNLAYVFLSNNQNLSLSQNFIIELNLEVKLEKVTVSMMRQVTKVDTYNPITTLDDEVYSYRSTTIDAVKSKLKPTIIPLLGTPAEQKEGKVTTFDIKREININVSKIIPNNTECNFFNIGNDTVYRVCSVESGQLVLNEYSFNSQSWVSKNLGLVEGSVNSIRLGNNTILLSSGIYNYIYHLSILPETPLAERSLFTPIKLNGEWTFDYPNIATNEERLYGSEGNIILDDLKIPLYTSNQWSINYINSGSKPTILSTTVLNPVGEVIPSDTNLSSLISQVEVRELSETLFLMKINSTVKLIRIQDQLIMSMSQFKSFIQEYRNGIFDLGSVDFTSVNMYDIFSMGGLLYLRFINGNNHKFILL